MNQYWSLIGAVLVRKMYQYWSKNLPYKRIPTSSPTRFSFTRRHGVYIRREGSKKKYQIGDTPYEKFATFAVLQASSTPHINITVL